MKGHDPMTVQPPPPTRGAPRGAKKEQVLVRENRALELRMAGATYAAIATALAYSDRRSAQRAVERAIQREADNLSTDREAFVRMQLLRTERLIRAHWSGAIAGDTAATETIRRLLERQSKLLGLDKPVRFEVTDAMDAEIESLIQDMDRLSKEAAKNGQA